MLDVVTESFIWCILFKRRMCDYFFFNDRYFHSLHELPKKYFIVWMNLCQLQKIRKQFFLSFLCFVRWFCSVFMYKLTGKLWLWNILKIMCLGYKEFFNYVYKNIFKCTLQVHCVECCYEIPFRNLKLSQDKQYYIWKL